MNLPSRLGNGFTANSMAWDSNGSIWASGNNSNEFVDGAADPELCNGTQDYDSFTLFVALLDAALGPALNSNGDTRYFRGKTGSGSLLSSSDLDSWNYRSNFPWSTSTSRNLSAPSRQQEQAISSIHLRNGGLTTDTTGLSMNDQDTSPFLPVGQHGRFGAPDGSFQEPPRQSGNTIEQQNTNSFTLDNFYNESNGEDRRWKINGAGFRANDSGSSTQSSLRFLNSNSEFSSLRSAKLQHKNIPTQSSNNFDLPETRPRSSRASNPPDLYYNSTSYPSHRLSGSTNRSISGRQDVAFQFDGQEDQLLAKFQKIDLKAEAMPKDFTPRFHARNLSQKEASTLDTSREAGLSRHKNRNGFEYMGLANQHTASSDGAVDVGYQFPTDYRQSVPFGDRESSSPTASDYRRSLNSPYYSANGGTPPTGPGSVRSASGNGFSNLTSNGHIVTVDRESRVSRLFHLDDEYMLGNPSHARLPYGQPFSFDGYPGSMRLNPLAVPYPIPAYGGLANSYQPRYPSRENDSSQIIRSALLEEFRANHKTSKRYELKVSRVIMFDTYVPTANLNRIFTTMLSSSAAISTARGSFNRNWRPPIATKKIKYLRRFSPILFS
jgi:mRNA-binding protein PUF3